ncbi:MAG: hypothetical protein HY919_04135 [Elusimicrobia bacterium]|nr:hypothetical protein [Elusimicrobiota bacterium]
MNSKMVVGLGLFCGLVVCLTSCGKKEPSSVPAEKPADEIAFESEVKQLIESGTDINQAKTTKYDVPIFYYAVVRRYVDAAKMLLEKGAQPNIQDKLGNTALSYAEKREMESVYQKTGKPYYPGADYDKTIEVLKGYGAK